MTRPHVFLPDVLAALGRREEQYPALVTAGKLSSLAADREISIWRSIAQDCRFVGGEPLTELAAKVETLAAGVRRFDRALAKEIDGLPQNIRIECFEGMNLWLLEFLFGEAVRPLLDIHDQRDRMAALRDWYRGREQAS